MIILIIFHDVSYHKRLKKGRNQKYSKIKSNMTGDHTPRMINTNLYGFQNHHEVMQSNVVLEILNIIVSRKKESLTKNPFKMKSYGDI